MPLPGHWHVRRAQAFCRGRGEGCTRPPASLSSLLSLSMWNGPWVVVTRLLRCCCWSHRLSSVGKVYQGQCGWASCPPARVLGDRDACRQQVTVHLQSKETTHCYFLTELQSLTCFKPRSLCSPRMPEKSHTGKGSTVFMTSGLHI